MSRRRHGVLPGADDEAWENLIFSFDMDGRLDLPEDFVVRLCAFRRRRSW